MTTFGIGSTQFADSCGIPRPSLSQILSGRNKKISDEVISKIHGAYPQLSVLWLLFGEGDMMAKQNIQFHDAQHPSPAGASQQPAGSFMTSDEKSTPQPESDSESLFGGDELIFDDDEPLHEVESTASAGSPTVQIPADGSKSIVNIMVFYSDNSYQSFVPR